MTHPAAAAATAAGHKYRAHQQAQAMAAAAGQAPPALAHALRDVLSLGANPERRPVDLHQGVAKGTWLPEEDKILIAYVAHHGPKDWNKLQTRGLLKRNGKSCRLRWVNQLKPGLQISKFLPGRTDNDVKNFWNLYIKRLKRIKGHHETLQQAHEDRELAAGGGGGDGGASGLAGGHGEPHDHHHGASRSEHLQQGLSAGAGAGAGHYEMGGQGPISSGSPSMSAGGGEGDLQDDPARASVSSHQGSPSPIQGQVQNQSQGQGQEAAILAGYTGIKHRLEPGKHVWPLQQRRREKAQARLGGSNGGACGGGAGCGSDISSALASNTSNLTGLTIDTSKVADKPAEMLLQQQDNIEDWLKTPTPSRHPMYVYPSSTYRYSPKYLSPRSPMTWSPGAFYSPRITRLRSPLPGGSEMSGDLSGSSLSLPGGLSAAMQPSQFSLADFEAAAGGSDAGSRLGLPLGGGGGGGAGLPGFEPAGARAEPLLDLSHHSNLGYQFQRPSHLGPSGSELLSKGGTTQPVQMMSAAASSQLSSTHLHLSGVPTKASGGAEIDMIATPGGGVGGGSMMVPLDMPLSKSPAGGGGQLAASLPFSEIPRQMEDLGSLGGGVLGNEHHAIMGTGGSGGIGVLLRSKSEKSGLERILGGGLKWEAGQQQPLGGSNGSGSGVLSRHHQHQSLSLGQSHSLKAGPGHSSYNGRALEREHLMLRATSASCLLDMPGSAGQLSSSSCERLRVARSHEGPLLGGGQVAAYEQLQVGSLGTTIPRALLRKSLGSYQQQVKAGGGMEGTMMLPIMETEASARAAARAARVAGAGGGGADGGRMDGRRGASSGGIKMEGGEQGEAGGPDASWQVEELIRSMLADNHDDLEPSPTSVPGVPAFSGSGSGSGGADQPFAD
eukprot:jgi/Mesen1/6052/ME000308S05247